MRILWVATKPPWPPVDGGRVLLAHTLAALARRGAEVTLVAPCPPATSANDLAVRLRSVCTPLLVPAPPRCGLLDALRARRDGLPLTIARHTVAAVRREVARLLATRRFDVVQAEQIQALPQCAPARATGVPVLLRAQNVESELWGGRAVMQPVLAAALRREAHRLACWEGAAVREAAATVALSDRDVVRLGALAGHPARVRRVAAPFPDVLPAGPALAGAPAVVVFGSRGWFPNRHGARWFVRSVWPRVRSRLPEAVLHVFGLGVGLAGPGIVEHGAPADSRTAFPTGAVLAVPLRLASGVRMKILEAWARGTPVVATPEAVAGLGIEPDREVLVADDGESFAAAIETLHRDAGRGRALTAAGRALLADRHRPESVANDLLALYSGVS